jgi:CheY-like chemotaxis protein
MWFADRFRELLGYKGEQGEIVVHIELDHQSADSVKLRFAVKDTGIGLPADKLDSIFQPFEQADVSTTRKYGGTGLGLAICMRLVELMGVEMAVESETGQGTTFTAQLGIGTPSKLPHSTSTPAKPSRGLGGMRVLVVDDNETNRRILRKMLENWGMQPVAVDSAVKGLAELRSSNDRKPIGLMLSDVNMPEMDGYDATAAIRKREAASGRHTPIIAMTAPRAFPRYRVGPLNCLMSIGQTC